MGNVPTIEHKKIRHEWLELVIGLRDHLPRTPKSGAPMKKDLVLWAIKTTNVPGSSDRTVGSAKSDVKVTPSRSVPLYISVRGSK